MRLIDTINGLIANVSVAPKPREGSMPVDDSVALMGSPAAKSGFDLSSLIKMLGVGG